MRGGYTLLIHIQAQWESDRLKSRERLLEFFCPECETHVGMKHHAFLVEEHVRLTEAELQEIRQRADTELW